MEVVNSDTDTIILSTSEDFMDNEVEYPDERQVKRLSRTMSVQMVFQRSNHRFIELEINLARNKGLSKCNLYEQYGYGETGDRANWKTLTGIYSLRTLLFKMFYRPFHKYNKYH